MCIRDSHSSESANSSLSSLQQARPSAKPLRLDLGVAAFEKQTTSVDKPRHGTKRSESERPAMRREHSGNSTRTTDSRRRQERKSQHEMVVMPEIYIQEDPIEAYSPQATAPQQQQQQSPQQSMHQRSRSSAHKSPYMVIEEEAEDGDEVHDLSDEPLAFEIIPPRPAHHRHRSQSRRAPDVRKIRIKVHAEDMRYVMTTPTATYPELMEQIRQKFSLQATSSFRLKIKDEEGDLVTLSDQDDLDMAFTTCKAAAAKERAEMGKMEVWLQEV